ncbi:hypothetical protein LCGC14_2176500, partial [marine sediment metagenome]
IRMPANGVSQAGRILLEAKLTQWDLRPLPNDWAWVWQVLGKGEYVGSFPKRVGKYYWQTHNRKLTPAKLSEIGNLASSHTPQADEYFVRFAEDFDWERGQFADPDSCYWTCHSDAKQMILGAGGLTMRLYESDEFRNDNGLARCWLMPSIIRDKQCYIVANGYGLATLQCTRILSVYLDHSYYHKIRLLNNDDPEGELWINGQGSAFLVGPQDVVVNTSEIDLHIEDVDKNLCEVCREPIPEDEVSSYMAPDGDLLCDECFRNNVGNCESCSDEVMIVDLVSHENFDLLCSPCLEHEFPLCGHCSERVPAGEACACQKQETVEVIAN